MLKTIVNTVGLVGLGVMLAVGISLVWNVQICWTGVAYAPTQLGLLQLGAQDMCVGAWGVELGNVFGGR